MSLSVLYFGKYLLNCSVFEKLWFSLKRTNPCAIAANGNAARGTSVEGREGNPLLSSQDSSAISGRFNVSMIQTRVDVKFVLALQPV